MKKEKYVGTILSRVVEKTAVTPVFKDWQMENIMVYREHYNH